MDRYAVLGNPVAHSRSPFIHAEFARQTRQDIAYERVLCPLDGFGAAVRQFAADGACGCNVTVPFKFDAFAIAQRHSPRAALAGAANLLRFDADGWFADNTDGVGLVRDIVDNARTRLRGARVLLLGGGGAAAGVLGPLLAESPAELVIANRTADKARVLAERHAEHAALHGARLVAQPLDRVAGGQDGAFDVLINATASSLEADGASFEAPVSPSALRPGALAVDLMYGAKARPFVQWAARHGATGRDGLGMLVEQAAEAFLVWRGVRPFTAPVLAALREAVDTGH